MSLVVQISAALSYLHGLPSPIIHGDIKGANILVNDKHEASLTDFGLSRIQNASGFTTKTASGTVRWQAYEQMVEQKKDMILRITKATDVWAFAMTVVEIITGCVPYSHLRSDPAVIFEVMSGGRPKHQTCPQINGEIWQMLEKCWDTDPDRRPSMDALTRFFVSQSISLSAQHIHL